jgi:hypothetical protein
VAGALAGLRQAFAADGYDLQVEDIADGVARIRIVAGPDACEDCLVPKTIMSGLMQTSLAGVPEVKQVELIYPTD